MSGSHIKLIKKTAASFFKKIDNFAKNTRILIPLEKSFLRSRRLKKPVAADDLKLLAGDAFLTE